MNTTENNIATITGKVSLTITKPGDGVPETVNVRSLPIKDFPAYLAAQENELAMVAMLTGKPLEWAESLDNASVEAVLKLGEELNRDFFVRWVNRRLGRQEQLIPGITAMLLKQNPSPSTSGLPKSPSPADSPSSKP